MPETNENVASQTDIIKHKDLTIQQVADIETRVKMDEDEEKPDFESYFVSKQWPKGRVSVQYRTLIHQAITPEEVANFTLDETVAPTGRGLEYGNFSETTKNYGTDFPYTWMDVAYNADSIVPDIASEGRNWVRELKTFIYGKALLSTKSSVAFPTDPVGSTNDHKFIDLFKKMKIIFHKLGVKGIDGKNFHCIMPVVDSEKMTTEYQSLFNGNGIPEDDKKKAMEGYIGTYKGIDIITPTSNGEKCLPATVGGVAGHFIIFIGKTETGRLPGTRYGRGGDSVEVIHNPLGTAVLVDKNGKYKADNNKQAGSVAFNVKDFSGHIYDDRAIITCFVPDSYVDGVFEEETDMASVQKTLKEVIAGKDGQSGKKRTYTEADADELDYNLVVNGKVANGGTSSSNIPTSESAEGGEEGGEEGGNS